MTRWPRTIVTRWPRTIFPLSLLLWKKLMSFRFFFYFSLCENGFQHVENIFTLWKKVFKFFQGVGSGSAPTCGNYFLFFAHFFLENRPILHFPLAKKADFAPNIQKQDSKRTGCIHLLGVARVPTRALLLRVPSFSVLLCVCYPTLLFTYRMLPAAPPLCFVACRGPTGSRTPSRS